MHNVDKQDTLKNSIKTLATKHTLSESELGQLMDMQKQSLDSPSNQDSTATLSTSIKSTKPWLTAKYAGIAASIFLCISLVFFYAGGHSGVNTEKVHDIATEVVKNHVKLKPLDIKTQNLRELQRFFTQVDFLPSASSILKKHYALGQEQLLGGRYCSIQGITATQLRYQNKQNQISTLYEVGYYPPAFGQIPDVDKGESPHTTNVKGYHVAMWVERNLLMVLVTEPKT